MADVDTIAAQQLALPADIQKAVTAAFEDLREKAWSNEEKLAKSAPNDNQPKAWFADPFALLDSVGMGYRNSPTYLTYDTLRQVAERDTFVAPIILTRIDQVNTFARPQPNKYSVGFVVRPRYGDKERLLTKSEEEKKQQLTMLLLNTGREYNLGRDGLRQFIAKFVRDSLTYDQACHPAGTLVEMADGRWLEIESVKVGDRVRTHTGKTQRVVETKHRFYEGEMYTFKSGGESISATAGHPLYVAQHPYFRQESYRRHVKLRWVEAKDIEVGGGDTYFAYPKPKIVEHDVAPLKIFTDARMRSYPNVPYSEIGDRAGVHEATARAILGGWYTKNGDAVARVHRVADEVGFKLDKRSTESVVLTEDVAKLFGLYVAEGNVNGNSLVLTFHSDETDYVDFVEDVARQLGVGTHRVEYEDRLAISIHLCSVELTEFMEREFGNGSANKRVPPWLMTAPKFLRSAFLTGYLAGDGSQRSSGIGFNTTSRDLFSGVRALCAGLGMFTRCVYSAPWRDDWSPQYRGNLSGAVYRTFAAENGIPCADPSRPREPYVQDDDFWYLPVRSVTTEHVSTMVYNLEVEEDHSYVANGFVSHNCLESVRTRGGGVHSFHAVPSDTIRTATPKQMKGTPPRLNELRKDIQYVQIINSAITAEFTIDEMGFCVRNPRSHIKSYGYGLPEIETLITTITSHLWAEEWNRRQFSQGSTIKGLLNVKGNVPADKMESFKRMWHSQVAGIQNAWRTPILNSEEVQWMPLQLSNQEMGYQMWIEYLVKITSALFRIDPAEINFDLRGGVGQQPVFMSTNEAQQKASKDRGLQPLLNFVEDALNRHIVWKVDPNFEVAFVGLDSKTVEQAMDLRQKQVSTTYKLNEVRALEGLPPVEYGDVVMNPTYIGYRMQLMQMEATAQQQQQPAPGQPGQGGPPPRFAQPPGADEEHGAEQLRQFAEKPGRSSSGDEGSGPTPAVLSRLHVDDWDSIVSHSLRGDDLAKAGVYDEIDLD